MVLAYQRDNRGVELGRWLMAMGFLLVVLGAVLYFLPRFFGWFGHLPGDIRIEGPW